ncbi:hypothetical protein EAO71_31295 [Streptomyces sp. ms191]|uniref:hypothetical protein n=1 Tax=unclassified Streptomyces TaxID=2593676 RepID=UPI0011CE9BFA|nr:hypothetical protein [Streptomyces sp. ms191]TXS20977.1 hypothetical protein EAO71_31295 [Streptomyces sp. ms191]
MISYTDSNSSIRFVGINKMTDRSVVSACSLGVSASAFIGSGLVGTGISGTAMPGYASLRPAAVLTGLPVMERDERPTKALEAGVAAGKASAHAFAATGAGTEQQTTKHYTMWAIRGLEPWSDPV